MTNVQRFILKHAERMLDLFKLSHFDLFLQTGKTRCSMDIKVDYTYLRAYLRIGDDIHVAYKNKDFETVLEALAHEITHIVVGIATHKAEDREDFNEEEEQAVEHIARIFFEFYKLKGGLKCR
jgi:hypothetical protein